MTRFTFTGTATGASVTAAKGDSGSVNPILDIRTASTGITVTLVASLATVGISGALTAVSAYNPVVINTSEIITSNNDDEWIVLAPGEGVVLYQDVAGTTSDTRKLNFGITWDEIDIS